MIDPIATAKMLQQIKSMGILLAIGRLRNWLFFLELLAPFSAGYIKNRSFLYQRCRPCGEGMEIAQTIMPMAKNLRLDVIAEGVETIEQVALLKKLNCKYAQGYYFSKPLARRK